MSPKSWFIPFVFLLFTLSGCGGDGGNSVQFTDLQITASENPIPVGFQTQLTATAFYDDGHSNNTDATWISLDEDTATVSKSGLVSALVKGDVSIQATTFEGTETFVLTITSAMLNSIELNPASEEVPLGINISYEAMGHFSDGSSHIINDNPDLVWHSTEEDVAIINKGTSRSDTLSEGTTTFTAVLSTVTSDITSNPAELTVTPFVLQSITITPDRVTWPVGLTQQFKAEGYFSNGDTKDISADVQWSSAVDGILELVVDTEDKGVFKGIAQGSSTVSANYKDEVFSDNQPLFIVEQVDITNFTVDSITGDDSQPIGKEVQFTAIAEFTDGSRYDVRGNKQVHWQSSDTDVATVTLSGLVKGLKTGDVTISASAAYDNAIGHKDIQITIVELETIVVQPEDGNLIITENKTQQFEAFARYTDGHIDETIEENTNFSWSVATSIETDIYNETGTPEASINDQGLLNYDNVGPSPGFASIHAKFMGISGLTSLALPMSELILVPTLNKEFIGVLTISEAQNLDVTYSAKYPESINNYSYYIIMTHSEAVQYCDQLLYNGNDDWSLPSSAELQTLWQSADGVDDGSTFRAGWVFGQGYWSTTENDVGHDTVSLYDGDIVASKDKLPFYTSCVRSTQ